MHKDYQAHTSLNPPLMCKEFDVKFEILYGKMAFEVINVLKLFLAFVMTFNVSIAQYMCTLQLDPSFKGLQCIMEYVGRDKVVTIMEEYDS
jgi:hypothetical protein